MIRERQTNPPGRIKIMAALSTLMREKDFHSITTAGIAREAGVTEGLIYKYFKDKKALLYEVLYENFRDFRKHIEKKIEGEPSNIGKLSMIIKTSLKSYAANRVFAKILLLEVRSSSDYFKSPAYEMVKLYSRTVVTIIRQGVASGEIRSDVDPHVLKQVVLGAIEHACLGDVIFEREIDTGAVSENICKIIFQGAES